MTKLDAVRIALDEIKHIGTFDTLSLTERVRTIIPEDKRVTDGTVTRYVRLLHKEFPYECINREMGKYRFILKQGNMFGG